MFRKEMIFFKENQDDLVKKHNGKILVIKGNDLIGVYDNVLEALKETSKEHKLGSFMCQPCEPGPEAYTVTISTLGIVKFGAS